MRFVFLLLSLVFINSLSAQTNTNSTILPKVSSNITIPISLPINEINRLINQSVTGVIYEDNSYTDNDNDQFKVKVEKQSNISIKALTGNRLMISVPLKIWAEKGYGSFGYYVYKDTNFNLVMNFISSIALNADWKINSQTTASGFAWTQKPVLDYGKVKIPIAPFIESTLKKQQASFTKIIDEQIQSKVNLKPILTQVWNQFASPMQISEEYNTWLKISPQNILMTPFTVYADKIKTSVGLELFSQTFVGEKPDNNPLITSIPNAKLVDQLPKSFNLQTTANISFNEATRLAKQQFLGKKFPINSDTIIINDIKLYAQKEKVVVEVLTDGKIKGTSFIKGNLLYDEKQHKIKFTKTDFSLKTKNIFQKAISILFEGKIVRMIEEEYGIPLLDIENASKKSILEYMNKEPYKGIRLQGKITNLKPSGFLISDNYITAIIDLLAEVQMSIKEVNL